MKKHSKFTTVVVVICVTIVILVISHSQPQIDDHRIELYKMGEQVNDLLSGKPIPNITCMDTMNNNIPLSDLLVQKGILIYHYSELHCNSCYQQQLTLIQDFFSDTSYPVLILASYLTHRHFAIHMKKQSYNIPTYRIEHKSFNWFIEDCGMPYFFVLNADMSSSYFYIPDNKHPELCLQYMERIKKLLLAD